MTSHRLLFVGFSCRLQLVNCKITVSCWKILCLQCKQWIDCFARMDINKPSGDLSCHSGRKYSGDKNTTNRHTDKDTDKEVNRATLSLWDMYATTINYNRYFYLISLHLHWVHETIIYNWLEAGCASQGSQWREEKSYSTLQAACFYG